jgi:DNA-binding Lrp family transcriptional regulator
VDDIDLDILRWMYPGGVWSSSGTDPRISATEIASHVGLDRTAVWARVRKWRREGFWDGYEVDINVAVFGVGLLLAQIHVTDVEEGWTLLDQLEGIDGVLSAGLIFGDSATTRDVELVGAYLVADDPEHIERRMRLIRHLPQARKVIGPIRQEVPPSPRELTPLDWRILACIVANPNASVARAARLVGVTRKTFDRHYSALIDDKVVGYYPMVDWSKMGCVTLGIYCRGTGDVDWVHQALEARFPHSIRISLDGIEGVGPDYDPSRCFAVIVPAHSPHEIQTLVYELSKVPGVKQVRPELWGPQRVFNGWIKQRIAEHFATQAAVVSSVVPRRIGSKAVGSATAAPAEEFELPLR